MRETNNIVETFRALRAEYAYNPDVFSEDNPTIARLKRIINEELCQVDRTIILLYIDCQSYRKLGKIMGLSHMTIRSEVLRIKQIIKSKYTNGIS